MTALGVDGREVTSGSEIEIRLVGGQVVLALVRDGVDLVAQPMDPDEAMVVAEALEDAAILVGVSRVVVRPTTTTTRKRPHDPGTQGAR